MEPAGDLSLFNLFWQAHIVVKLVIVGLVGASVWCWAIIVDKIISFGRLRRRADAFERSFWSGESLDDLYGGLKEAPTRMHETIFVAAMGEWKRSHQVGRAALKSLQSRIDRVIDVALAREIQRLEARLLFLASVGSAAPFIGLFGTVWGIMNSFQAIAASKSTNLAVVAPGITEALFATALGLLAAIPAVIAYNKFSNDVNKLSGKMEGFADEFSAILSRQIDERSQ